MIDFKLVDTHAHIYSQALAEIPNWLEEAKSGGVQAVIMPNIDLESIEKMLEVESNLGGFAYSTIGLHPCHVFEDYKSVLKKLEARLNGHSWVAIGETGLDYFHDKKHIEEQKRALSIQLTWAKESGIPIILHTRDALEDTIDLVKQNQDGSLKGVFHCFSGTPEEAVRIKDLGFMIGIGGVMTYPKANMVELCLGYPEDIIVLETDAPYLPPVPHRGKVNHPGYLPIIAHVLANAKGLSINQIAEITSVNAQRLFNLPSCFLKL